MILLGIDPGLTKQNPTGMALISDDPIELIWSDVIIPNAKLSWDQRLGVIIRHVKTAVANTMPYGIVYELPHMQDNAQTLMKLAHVCGGIVAVAEMYGIPYLGVQPTTAKRAWTGNHRASKADMIAQTQVVFKENLVKDAADACGIAWSGFGHFSQLKQIEKMKRE